MNSLTPNPALSITHPTFKLAMAAIPAAKKEWWPCEWCNLEHIARPVHGGKRIQAYCPSLGTAVYSRKALKRGQS